MYVMKKKIIPAVWILLVSLLMTSADFIQAASKQKKTKSETTAKNDSTETTKKKGLVPYDKVITAKARTMQGFITVHSVEDKYYFEVPDTLLGRDILVVNRIAKAPVNVQKSKSGYPGDFLSDQIIRFEFANNEERLFLREIAYEEYSSDTLGLYNAVSNSNIQPIIAALKIKSIRQLEGHRWFLLDVTDVLNKENGPFAINERVKDKLGLSTQQDEMSYIDTLKAFPTNVEIRTVRTFKRKKVTPTNDLQRLLAKLSPDPTTPLTYELNTSLLLLPATPMRARMHDRRVGYFAVSYADYDANPQGVDFKGKITRWRLEPRKEDIQRYLKGELVEPAKPIVIYIDPATPRKWVPYLIQGINDWQEAFEAAGFKKAIVAKEAPENDSTWSLEDARHSALVYKASEIGNASGPHVHDPRSGEIIETHINWYHNILSVLYNWYIVQAGPLDPAAQKPVFDDELMGALVRYVCCHEVGHTLGLRHNFGASATIPVAKLRDKAWVEKHGDTPSIMDYARFNYVAQPEDSISREGLFPHIGIYDKWAIEWGYRWFPPFDSAEDENIYMQNWILKKLAEDPRYRFGHEFATNDPRNQSEDLGDNSMLASAYGIKNLKRIMPHLIEWTTQPYKGFDKTMDVFQNLMQQFSLYMKHVSTNLGGIYGQTVMYEQRNENAMEFVPRTTQQEAIKFLCQELFSTPRWLIDRELTAKTGLNIQSALSAVQNSILKKLVSAGTLDKMNLNLALNGKQAYSPSEMLSDLEQTIFSSKGATDLNGRILQKNYLKALTNMLDKQKMSGSAISEAPTIARARLELLLPCLKQKATAAKDAQIGSHYRNLVVLIENAFNPAFANR